MKIKHLFLLFIGLFALNSDTLRANEPPTAPATEKLNNMTDNSPLDSMINNATNILENQEYTISPEYLLSLNQQMATQLQALEPKIKELVDRGTPWNPQTLNTLKEQLYLLTHVNTLVQSGEAYEGMQKPPTPEERAVSEEYYRITMQFLSDFLAILAKNGIK